MLCLASATAMSIASCAGAPQPLVVRDRPALESYGPEFLTKAADELASMRRSCGVNELSEDCSAVRSMLNDYWTLRTRIENGD